MIFNVLFLFLNHYHARGSACSLILLSIFFPQAANFAIDFQIVAKLFCSTEIDLLSKRLYFMEKSNHIMPPKPFCISLNGRCWVNRACINNSLLKAPAPMLAKADKKYVHLTAENRLCDLLNPALPL
jgi:hypothetical protein